VSTLPRAAAYPVALQRAVDGYLSQLTFATDPATAGLEEAMLYSLLAPGKRVRPVLALATGEALGRSQEEVMPLAASLELVHTYSLIHDDLPAMDDDELRRGRPTCHVAYGEDVAILAGDGLFAEAIRLILDEQAGPPANVMAALRALVAAVAVDGMVGGQYFDVTSSGDLDGPALRRLHELKTGRLIGASIDCVLLVAGSDPDSTLPFRRFAAELGVLFQIVDDILDVIGDEATLGKPPRSDERHGKSTYVSVYGLDHARELASFSHAKARHALAEVDGRTETLEQITDYILTRPT